MVGSDEEFSRIASQIGESKRQVMDALTKDQLRYEISRGTKSVHSRYIPYLQILLTRKEDAERATERSEDLGIAKDANRIAAKAHTLSKWAIFISALAILVSLFRPGD